MNTHFSSRRFVAFNLVVGCAFVVTANVAWAEEGAATAPAVAVPAVPTMPAVPAMPAAPAAGDLTGAAKVGSGVAVEHAVQGGDMKAAGQKGVSAGVDAYMGGAPTAPAAETAPAAPAAE